MRRRAFLGVAAAAAGGRSRGGPEFREAPPSVKTPDLPYQRGIGLDPFPGEFQQTDLELLRRLGADSISIYPYGFMESYRKPIVRRYAERSNHWFVTDRGFRRLAAMAHGAGLRVVVQPHLEDFTDGSWRGEMEMTNEADWRTWFESYRSFLLHYARLSAEVDAEGFSVGTELRKTVHREAEWRATISRAREAFPGWLTYAANWWEEVDMVPWWDAVDAIGVQAYYPVGTGDSVAAIEAEWRPVQEHLVALSARWRRPVLFTEIGYKSHAGSTREPWRWEIDGVKDEALQARAYEAAFNAFGGKPWFKGMYWWKWHADRGAPSRWERDFTPQGKAAEHVLRRRFRAE